MTCSPLMRDGSAPEFRAATFRPRLLLVLAVLAAGCGQGEPVDNSSPQASVPVLTPTETDHAPQGQIPSDRDRRTSRSQSTAGPTPLQGDSSAATPVASPPALRPARVFAEAAFLDDDVVGVVVVHPRRATQSRVYRACRDAGLLTELERQVHQLGVDPAAIERLVVVFDPPSVRAAIAAAEASGADARSDDESGAADAATPENAGARSSNPLRCLTAILSLAAPIDRTTLLESALIEPEEQSHDGQTLYTSDGAAVCFSDDQTLLCGPVESVKRMIANRKTDRPGEVKLLAGLDADADLAVALDLKSQSHLMGYGLVVTIGTPVLGLWDQFNAVTLAVNAGGKPGDPLVTLAADAVNEPMANAITSLATNNLAEAKKSLDQWIIVGTYREDAEALGLLHRITRSAAIRQNGTRVEFQALVPEGFDQLADVLSPVIKKAVAAGNSDE